MPNCVTSQFTLRFSLNFPQCLYVPLLSSSPLLQTSKASPRQKLFIILETPPAKKIRDIVLYGWWLPSGTQGRFGLHAGTTNLLCSALSPQGISNAEAVALKSRSYSLSQMSLAVQKKLEARRKPGEPAPSFFKRKALKCLAGTCRTHLPLGDCCSPVLTQINLLLNMLYLRFRCIVRTEYRNDFKKSNSEQML